MSRFDVENVFEFDSEVGTDFQDEAIRLLNAGEVDVAAVLALLAIAEGIADLVTVLAGAEGDGDEDTGDGAIGDMEPIVLGQSDS